MSSIIVAGAIANKPSNGGAAWTRLSWVLGLRRLGFDVWFVERLERHDPVAEAWFGTVLTAFGLEDSGALVIGNDVRDASWRHMLDVTQDSRLLINISGHLDPKTLRGRVGCKVFVDLDPGVTQLWHAGRIDRDRLAGHDFYFTVGTNIGTDYSSVPTADIKWRTMFPPCVLHEWPVAATESNDRDRFTTVASWRGPYSRVEHGGHTYGIKLDEFRKFAAIPRRAGARFEVALDIHRDEERDLALLNSNGWHLVNPRDVAGDPAAFRRYVQGSAAEFSVAQGIYVETASGWFSDRTTRYLASGKPALIQDTGFSRNLPTGEGLVAFTTPEEAVAGVAAIMRDYESHAHAARQLAVEHFDSDKVLGRLLEVVGV